MKSVLEIGCGTGSFLRLMRASGLEVLGLEPDIAYSEASQERYRLPVLPIMLEDFRTPKQYNFVCSFHVIEHVEDPNDFLHRIANLTKDGGYLFLECPAIDRWYGRTIDYFFWDAHINTFSERTLKAFLLKCGFEVISSEWREHFLIMLARKSIPQDPAAFWDDPGRIKGIVREAKRGEAADGLNNRRVEYASMFARALRVARENPVLLPKKVAVYTVRRAASTDLYRMARRKVRSVLGQRQKRPSHPNGGAVLDAPYIARRPSGQVPTLKMVHVGQHKNGNAGDTLLFPAVRQLFQEQVAPIDFHLLSLHARVTEETIDRINRHDGLVIGGGGLFLSDTNPNKLSGWQWPCPVALLEKIKVPIFVFGVGYNQFRGQADFHEVFDENVLLLVEKSSFFGLRNSGSMERLKERLPARLHPKVVFQPCPTTVLRHFYSSRQVQGERSRTIALNIAFDRHHLRFGKDEDDILWELAETIKELQEKGWEPVLFPHDRYDLDAHFWLRSRGVFLDTVNLYGAPPAVIIEAYGRVAWAMGMRGHAQMIPFGLGRPIYSLISHDKLQFFLDDIGHPEWGCEVQLGWRQHIIEAADAFDETRLVQETFAAQGKLWDVTLNNTARIRSVVGV